MENRDKNYWAARRRYLTQDRDCLVNLLLLLYFEIPYLYFLGISLGVWSFMFSFFTGILSGFLFVRMELAPVRIRTFRILLLIFLFLLSIFVIPPLGKGPFLLNIAGFLIFYLLIVSFFFLGYWTGAWTQYTLWQHRFISASEGMNLSKKILLLRLKKHPSYIILLILIFALPYMLIIRTDWREKVELALFFLTLTTILGLIGFFSEAKKKKPSGQQQ